MLLLQVQIDSVPLYAHVKEVLAAPCMPIAHSAQHSTRSAEVEALEINYLTFYAYNGPYNVGGVRLIQTGQHVGDWEHITARQAPAAAAATFGQTCRCLVVGQF